MVFSEFPEGVLLNVNEVNRFEIYPAVDTCVIEAVFDNDHSVILYDGLPSDIERQLAKLAAGDFTVKQLPRWLKYGTQVFNLEKVLYFEVDVKFLTKAQISDFRVYDLSVCYINYERQVLASGSQQNMMNELHKLSGGNVGVYLDSKSVIGV